MRPFSSLSEGKTTLRRATQTCQDNIKVDREEILGLRMDSSGPGLRQWQVLFGGGGATAPIGPGPPHSLGF